MKAAEQRGQGKDDPFAEGQNCPIPIRRWAEAGEATRAGWRVVTKTSPRTSERLSRQARESLLASALQATRSWLNLREQAVDQPAERCPQLRARFARQNDCYPRPVSADIYVGMRKACAFCADGGHARSPVRSDHQASVVDGLFQTNPGQLGLGVQGHLQL
jgi:hypothetical protein